MVNQHYRWDFIGLSTDDKPTFASSPKVTDGSTFYESDTSKLYVWYQDQWYEKEDTGGGSSINVVQTTGDSTTDVMSQDAVTQALAGAGGPTVVQTVGSSTTDVMSQNATTSMVFADPSTRNVVQIGANASNSADNSVAIGNATVMSGSNGAIAIGGTSTEKSSANQAGSIAIGVGSNARLQGSVSIGMSSQATVKGSIALGTLSSATQKGEMNIGSTNTSYGYNNSNYRLLSGVYDGQSAHDAATYGQLDTRLGGLTLVSLTQAEYDALSTKDANTLYVIKAA